MAFSDPDKGVQLRAVKRLSGSEPLFKVADEHPEASIRIAAINKIKDDDSLNKIYIYEIRKSDPSLRVLAILSKKIQKIYRNCIVRTMDHQNPVVTQKFFSAHPGQAQAYILELSGSSDLAALPERLTKLRSNDLQKVLAILPMLEINIDCGSYFLDEFKGIEAELITNLSQHPYNQAIINTIKIQNKVEIINAVLINKFMCLS